MIVAGVVLSDTFCFAEFSCVPNFNYFYGAVVNDAPDMNILGLGPEVATDLPPSLASALKTAGLIGEAKATLWLNGGYYDPTIPTATNSTLTFGEAPTGITSGSWVEHEINNKNVGFGTNLWTIKLKEIKQTIGGKISKFESSIKYAVVEPAWYMAVPPTEWSSIMSAFTNTVTNGATCTNFDGLQQCYIANKTCSDLAASLPAYTFKFETT